MFIPIEEVVNPQENLVSDEEIISVIYEIYPQIIYTDLLKNDYGNYIASIPEHCNDIILNSIVDNFKYTENYFIEVTEDASFSYDYGDISSVHNCTITSGYVPRTPEYEAIAIDNYWEDDYY